MTNPVETSPGSASSLDSVVLSNIQELFQRMTGVERSNKELAESNKNLQTSQDTIMKMLNNMNTNINKMIDAGVQKAFRTPTQGQTFDATKEPSIFQNPEKNTAEDGDTSTQTGNADGDLLGPKEHDAAPSPRH